MIKRIFLIGLGLCCAGSFTVADVTSVGTTWVLSRADLVCVGDALDAYRTAQSEPFIIVLSACPETDPALAIIRAAEGDLFERRSGAGRQGGRRNVIKVAEQDLLCLVKKARVTVGDEVVVEVGNFCE